jgi:hypothetical protein
MAESTMAFVLFPQVGLRVDLCYSKAAADRPMIRLQRIHNF